MTANQLTCPNNASMVMHGMKFCESCDDCIEALPVCCTCPTDA